MQPILGCQVAKGLGLICVALKLRYFVPLSSSFSAVQYNIVSTRVIAYTAGERTPACYHEASLPGGIFAWHIPTCCIRERTKQCGLICVIELAKVCGGVGKGIASSDHLDCHARGRHERYKSKSIAPFILKISIHVYEHVAKRVSD